MPTRGRPQFALRALECFLSQTWPNKELVILDDQDAPSFPDGIVAPGIYYERLKRRYSIGAKRNMCCSRASGDILIHWDDDDECAPERMADQVARLQTSAIGFTGYHSMIFEDGQGRRWKYRNHVHYALGTSFCYTREFWETHPFPDVNRSEDNAIVNKISGFPSVDAGEMIIARIHSGNTSEKTLEGNVNWTALAA